MKYWLGKLFFALIGWKAIIPENLPKKYVIIVAPHTSNWDFFIGLFTTFVLRLKTSWLAKHTIFFWPVGPLLRALGGIPIDRRSSQNMVEEVVKYFSTSESFVIGLAPEGTRKRTEYCKSGFYHIAVKADVPLVLAFIDYKQKVSGLDRLFKLSGNPKEDMKVIRAFYQQKTGKKPQEYGPIRIKEEDQ